MRRDEILRDPASLRRLGYQTTLVELPTTTVVNVASVPHRSPFRYPGGKTWLVPRVRQWLNSLSYPPSLFIEPFAGGSIVGLTVAFEELAQKVLLVELDEQVAAVWQTIFSDDCEWLVKRILSFNMTLANLHSELRHKGPDIKHVAFRTVLKNRTFHGGILASGSRPIRRGENGKGLRSRWYPETLARRIRAIAGIRDRITFLHGDGLEALRKHKDIKDAVFYIDPPYTVAGKRAGSRLYTYHQIDHNRLFDLAVELEGDFLMTYDDDGEVVRLARRHELQVRRVAMKTTHHTKTMELLIARNLDWLP